MTALYVYYTATSYDAYTSGTIAYTIDAMGMLTVTVDGTPIRVYNAQGWQRLRII